VLSPVAFAFLAWKGLDRVHLALAGLVIAPAPSIHVNKGGRTGYGLACSKAGGSYLLCSRG